MDKSYTYFPGNKLQVKSLVIHLTHVLFTSNIAQKVSKKQGIVPACLIHSFSLSKSLIIGLLFLAMGAGSVNGQIAQRGTATTATSTTTTLTINKPTGLVAGDVMIIAISQLTSKNAITAPTGWTLIDERSLAGTTSRYGAVFYKIAGSSEGINYSFTLGSGTTSSSGAIVAFSGVNNTTPFDATNGTISVSANSQTGVAATAITTATANAAVIMLGMSASGTPTWSGWTTTSPATLTELADVQSTGTGTSTGIAWAIKPVAGSTGAGAATLSVASRNGGLLIALKPNNTISLTSAAGTNAQTLCINSAITNITYATTGATGATITGLPSGVTGSWAGNAVTISGTPTVSGTFNYTVTLTGGSNTGTATGTITVTPANTILLTSAAGTNAQTICISTPITNITYATTGATGATVTGLPAGVTGSWAGNVVTISGTPTVSGPFSYTVTLTGGCSAVTATGTITVTATTTPTTTGASICIGTTAALTASGAGAGDKYKWYDAASGGTLLYTSASNADNTYTTPVLAVTTNYWVSILNAGGCEGARTLATATFPSVSTDAQTPGTNSWIGYVYDGINLNSYYGHYTEPEIFDESFGGATNCFSITSNSATRSIYTETFSVHYLMNSTKKGLYVVDLGSDDGSRLTVDGTLLYNNWNDQAFTSRPAVLMNLTGTSALTYDFYENGGENRVVYQNLTQVLGNTLSGNLTQTICLGTTGAAISGDTYGALPAGITLSGTGYQWSYGTSPTGPWTDISGATSATYSPSSSAAPFNVAGTYYLIRKASLSSANNVNPAPYVATNSSNAATLTVNPNNTILLSSVAGTNAQTLCINTGLTNITYATTGATGAAFSGLPTGVTGSWAGNVVTINGAPTVSGPFSYTVTLTGGCSTVTANGTITVNPATAITANPSTGTQTQCVTTGTFTALSVTATGVGLSYQWYKNASSNNTTGTVISGATAASYTPLATTVGTLYYYCTVGGTCTSVTSAVSGAIIVTPATAISSQSTAAQTQCINVPFSPISVIASGTGTLTYQWYSNATAINSGGTLISGAIAASYTPSATIVGTLYYYCIVGGTCTSVTSAVSGAFVVNPATAITTNPSTGTQTQCVTNGTFTALSVVATGTGILTYQWYSNATSSNSGGTIISGATSASYTPLSTTVGTLYYYCIVGGTCTSVTSAVSGAFIVTPATAISSQSTAAQTQCINVAFSPISVTATGTGTLTYQWYSNATAINSGGTLIPGATATSYTPSATTVGTLYYYCIVGGTCTSVTSAVSGAFMVNPATAIATNPSTGTQTQCVTTGTFTALSVTATGAGLTYQWYKNASSNNTTGTVISGATAASYTPLATAVGTLYYYCTVGGTCNSATSAVSGAFIVTPATAISSQSTAAQTQCINVAFSPISVLATGTGTLTYQWYSNATAINSGGTIIPGAASASYTPSAATAGTLYYYCTVAGTCTSVTSAVSGAFIVSPATAINSQSTAAQTQCINVAFSPISVTATGTGTLTYQWYSNASASNSGGTIIPGATSASYTPSAASAGTLYYYCTVAGTCTSVTSAVSGAFVVNPATAITTNPSTGTQTQCVTTGTFTALSVTATGMGLTYQWYSNTASNNTTGTSITGATSASYTPLATTAGTFYYYCIVGGTCTSVTSAVSGAFTVNPATAITTNPNTGTQTQCVTTGTFTALSVTATGVGLTYQWYKNASSNNTTGTSISGATAASYTPLATTAGTLYYYCTVGGTCTSVTSGVSGAFVVNPVTAISSQSTVAQTQCINVAFSPITVTASGAGLTYQWYSNTIASTTGGTSLPAANGGQTSSYTPLSTTVGTLYYYCIVGGTCTSVTSAVSGAFIVTPATAISSQSTAAQTQCINVAFSPISVLATGTGTLTYQWYSNATAINSGGTIISGATAASYTPSATTAGTLYYYCIVAGTCTSVTSTVSGAFMVNPITSITNQSTGGQTQFQNSAFAPITVTASGAGLSYQWYSNTTASTTGGTSLLAANGGQTFSYTPQSTTVGTLYYYCNVSGACSNVTSAVSGAFVVNTIPPAITISTGSLTGFSYAHGTTTGTNPSQQLFTVSGTHLLGNITITAPADFEISTAAGTLFVSTPTITLPPSGGSVAATTIYVRLKVGSPVGTYTAENIICATTGATAQNVTATGTVTAANYYSIAPGNWNANTTWSATSGGTAVGTGIYPLAGDIVYIERGYTVTVNANAACASVNFSTPTTPTLGTLAVSSGYTLAVSGAITLNNAAAANVSATISGAGTLTCASISLGNNTGTTTNTTTYTHTLISAITALTVTGNLTINSYFVATSRISNGVFTHTSGTVTINGSISTVNANAANTSTYALGNTSPTLILGGVAPFSISGTGASAITLNGTGSTVNYTGAGQAVGAYTYNNLTLSGSGVQTAAGAISAATLITSAGTTLNMQTFALSGVTNITNNGTVRTQNTTATPVSSGLTWGGTVTFDAAGGQTIPASTFNNLSLSGGGTKSQGGAVTVNGTLTLTSGILALGAYNLILGALSPSVAGTFSASNMIVTNGTGLIQKMVSGNGSYTYPLGDITGTAEYSPITLNFTSGTYAAGAYVTGKVTNAKQPNNTSVTNYLNRYWTITPSGITAFTANVSGTYVPADVAGTESSQVAGRYTGSLPWIKYSALGSNTLTATGVTGFGDFTGINNIPTLTTSTTTLSGFTYPVGYGPSAEQTFTVSGTDLTSNITVSPSAGFEISTGSGASFVATNPITLIASGGMVNSTTIYVRMKTGLASGAVAAQNVVATAIGATTKNVACSGTVGTDPVITSSISTFPVTFTYSYTTGPSSQQTFNISGTNLIDNVVITPPTDFEISTTSGSGFVSTPISLTPSGGIISTTPIYARLKTGLGVGSYSESLVLTSTSATTLNVTCNGTITSAPTIVTIPSFLSGFIYTYATPSGGPSGQQSFVVNGSNLGTNAVTVAPPPNYEISTTSGSAFQSTAISLTPVSGAVNKTIYARLKAGLAAGTYGPANDSIKCTGAVIKTVAFSGSVVSAATVLTSKSALTGFGYLSSQGGPSGEQTFTVSGASLTSSITVSTPTPTSNYEISLTSGTGFQQTITLPLSGGMVNPTTIYVRLKSGKVAGNYNENITAVSGVTSQTIGCIGIVFVSPLITAGGGGSYCEGSTVNLTSTGASISNLYWQGPNGYYSTAQSPSITGATTSMSGTYTVTGSVTVGGNLITNGDFEMGSFGIGSGYIYTVPGTSTKYPNGNLWPEGYFTVDKLPSTSHTGFGSCVDHTTGSGKQMIINGAGIAGVVIWSQSVSVIPGATYQFTYWVQTVDLTHLNPSQLQLYVNGVAAGPTYTADAVTCGWKQFIYNATSGSNTSLNLELINQNIALNGNDFALDDIVFTQILPATSSVVVTVNPNLPVSVSVAASANPVYSGAPVTFTATPTNGGTTPAYQWKVNGTIVGTNSATYSYTPLTGDVVTCVLTSSYTCTTGNPASNGVTMTVNTRTNYWMGSIDTDWGKTGNWTANYIPLAGDDVVYATTSNYGSVAMNDLQLDNDRTIGNLINATTKSLVIPATKGLIVNYTISTDGNPDRVYIQSSPTLANGSLTFHNTAGSPVNATVEMYSKASFNLSDPTPSNRYKWQYFGIPLRSVVANPTFYGSYVRKWYESGTTISNHWLQLGNDSVLTSFIGYELCQQAPKTIVFQGQLENGDFNSGSMAVTPTALYPGQHVFANPYTAAIDITKLTFGSQTEATVYLYNTGTFNQWTNNGGQTTPGNNPGQYTAVPQNTAGVQGLPLQVPSMQAMLVKAMTLSSQATFGVTYNSVVMNNTDQQRVQASEDATASGKICTMIDVAGTNFTDRMWIFSDPSCSRQFDNGWDGSKMLGSALSPQVYAIEPDGNYQVDGVDDMNNTNLGFQAGEDVNYTFTFTHTNIQSKYAGVYLMDKVENKIVDITESGSTYSFLAETTNQTVNRFEIITRPYEKGAPDLTSQLKVFSSKGTILAQNFSTLNGTLIIYDIAGHTLRNVALAPNGGITVVSGLIPGAYIGKAVTSKEGVSKRLIVQ